MWYIFEFFLVHQEREAMCLLSVVLCALKFTSTGVSERLPSVQHRLNCASSLSCFDFYKGTTNCNPGLWRFVY